MSTKYNSLEELRRKRDLLRNEVKDLEDLITFDNAKESLSAITHGFTDAYLKEKTDEKGHEKLALNTDNIVKDISTKIKDNFTKNSILGVASSPAGSSLLENTLKIGAVALAGNFAKKNLNSSSWKKKVIGLALIYLAPIALKFLRRKLDEYQKNKAASSMEQLI